LIGADDVTGQAGIRAFTHDRVRLEHHPIRFRGQPRGFEADRQGDRIGGKTVEAGRGEQVQAAVECCRAVQRRGIESAQCATMSGLDDAQ
jgi:hypothetical protein